MEFLKGRIRGSRKNHLGGLFKAIQGAVLGASDPRTQTAGKGGQRRTFDAAVMEVMQKDMAGEKMLFPLVRVMLITKDGFIPWPYWLKIKNTPDEIWQFYGGMKAVSETKPNCKVTFTSSTRKKGYVVLGSSSPEVDDYSDGQSCEYEGFDMA